jgi:hypothetical protein
MHMLGFLLCVVIMVANIVLIGEGAMLFMTCHIHSKCKDALIVSILFMLIAIVIGVTYIIATIQCGHDAINGSG